MSATKKLIDAEMKIKDAEIKNLTDNIASLEGELNLKDITISELNSKLTAVITKAGDFSEEGLFTITKEAKITDLTSMDIEKAFGMAININDGFVGILKASSGSTSWLCQKSGSSWYYTTLNLSK